MQITPEIVASSQDPSSPTHHVDLGKILATVTLALSTVAEVLPNPVQFVESDSFAKVIAGFIQIWTAAK